MLRTRIGRSQILLMSVQIKMIQIAIQILPQIVLMLSGKFEQISIILIVMSLMSISRGGGNGRSRMCLIPGLRCETAVGAAEEANFFLDCLLL